MSSGAFFYALCMGAAGSSLGALLSKNVFRAAIFFLITLLCVAGLFVGLSAEFVAAAQLLIYAGGIAVVILFAIMLTTRLGRKPLAAGAHHVVAGYVVALSAFLTLSAALLERKLSSKAASSTMAEIGPALLGAYAAPLEVAGILLLLSLIGATAIAGSGKPRQE